MTELEQLLQRTLAGDAQAWQALQLALDPTILGIARGHRSLRSKGLAALPDELAEIRTKTLERLSHDDFRNLRRFAERTQLGNAAGGESWDAWLYGAVDFVIREHLRSRYGRAPKLARGEAAQPQPSKRDLQSHAGRLDERAEPAFLHTLGMTARLSVAEILAHVAQEFAADEASAIRLHYVEDQDFAQVARALGLGDAHEAERLIRKLNARLRYRFAKPHED